MLGGLALTAAAGLALAIVSDSDDDADEGPITTTSTTLLTGGIDVDAPAGFLAVPLPSFEFGIAVPDDWQVTRTDADTIAALEGQPLVNEGFVDSARNAGTAGAVLYAAGVDDEGRVSDAKVIIYAVAKELDRAALEQFAADLVAETPLPDAEVRSRTINGDAAVTIGYRVSGGGVEAAGTQLLRVDGDRIVSVVVTSEDTTSHDALADAITGSLVLA